MSVNTTTRGLPVAITIRAFVSFVLLALIFRSFQSKWFKLFETICANDGCGERHPQGRAEGDVRRRRKRCRAHKQKGQA